MLQGEKFNSNEEDIAEVQYYLESTRKTFSQKRYYLSSLSSVKISTCITLERDYVDK